MVKAIFYKNDSIMSKLISLKTHSEYTHVGLLIDDYHVIDINYKHNLRIRHLNSKRENFKIVQLDLNKWQEEKLLEYIYSQLTTRYDFNEILRFFFKNLKDNKQKLICSEFIYDALIYVEYLNCSHDDIVSPSDLLEILTQ